MKNGQFDIAGLSDSAVLHSRKKFGANSLQYKKIHPVFEALKNLAKEPMILILLIAVIIYLITGHNGDALFLLTAIIIISVITLFQDSRSRNALEKLSELSLPKSTVIRNHITIVINSSAVVVGDYLVVEEGSSITADGTIVYSNDFAVNESILTGESFSVEKNKNTQNNQIYHGTTVARGLAIVTVFAIGNNTKLGKIGKSLEAIKEEKTPLEIQINNFVKYMVFVGLGAFLTVWILNYNYSKNVLDSLLKALTLAMSILPEEIPMAFTTFMAIGAWRLMKMGIVVKQMKTVETLGSATVICTDKTGTITQNKMSLAQVYSLKSNQITKVENFAADEKKVIELAMWASEPTPFDPMEKALHQSYSTLFVKDQRPYYKLVHEYPLDGKPPMMTHVFENAAGTKIIASKGAPEALLAISNLSVTQKIEIEQIIKQITTEGYRILAVGQAQLLEEVYPKKQQDFNFDFIGIVSFYDPPKKNIANVLQKLYSAGITVKIITGDSAETTASIAKQIGFKGYQNSISGDKLMLLPKDELEKIVLSTNIFTRMFPEAKLKIIEALKANGEIVAMTGDGVNDGPALKAAHIGIAMGKKGTEIAKQAASLILVNDDLSKMVDAVAIGRKIYTNLKKAFRYIISIHIPIILTVFVPLALGWVYPNIFAPIHIIFLELIMGPTCSIIFENEPLEKDTMSENPRPITKTFFNCKELGISILQGLTIAVGTLLAYNYSVLNKFDEALTRTIVFTILISANIFLTLVNRSFHYSILKTIYYKNNRILMVIALTLLLTVLLLYVPAITTFFQFKQLSIYQLVASVVVGFVSVIWVEIPKVIKNR